MVELEQMREKHLLQDRIELLGNVAPGDVHSVRSAILFVFSTICNPYQDRQS
jgi:hypothetical protein